MALSCMIDPVKEFPDDRRGRLLVAAGWAALLLAAVVAYWPGLNGPFLLDDYGSLGDLGDRGGVKDWATFKAFVFGGHAGSLGRPVALLSFLVDGNNWPTDPWPFKRTNLILHLLNGLLIGLLTFRVLRLLQFSDRNAQWIALASTACWLLHPFLVSTTLYAVQRMAQLSAFFVFAGLNVHLVGRSYLQTRSILAYAVMTLSLGLFTGLAMFSKENGILLPALVGVLEITIVASQRPRLPALNRYWFIVCIVVPVAAIAWLLGGRVMRDDFFDVVPPRHYSAFEGFLTQMRVLVDYLRHWFVPELYTSGVYQDHVLKSTGILSPVTTLLSLMIHVTMIVLATVKRRKWPLFAFAVLFFYVGHVLESTVLNLELYFEHRNYMTAPFLFLPLAVLLFRKATRPVFLAVTAAAILVLGGFTRYSATVWESLPSIIDAAARKAPTSVRAQAAYATQLFNAARYDESLEVIDRAVDTIDSDHPLLLVNRMIIRCQLGLLTASEFQEIADSMSGSYYDSRSIKLYTSLTESVVMNKCPPMSALDLRHMYEGMLTLPVNGDPQTLGYSHIQYFIGFASVYAGEPVRAVAAFEESLRSRPGASHAMLMAAHLATLNHFDEALEFAAIALDQLDVEAQGILGQARVSADDIRAFRAVVSADKEAAQVDGPGTAVN